MVRWAPARADVIGEYAAEVVALYPQGRILVGVGGLERAARDAFARDLADALAGLGTVSAALSLDDFAVDVTGEDPDALLRDAYNVAAFRRTVLDPYRRGESFELRTRTADGSSTERIVPGARAVLVVSGAFVHRSDLIGIWHASAWLQVARAVARQREATRLGLALDDPAIEAAFATVDRFFQHTDPRKLANASFDLTDAAHPRRVFADAC